MCWLCHSALLYCKRQVMSSMLETAVCICTLVLMSKAVSNRVQLVPPNVNVSFMSVIHKVNGLGTRRVPVLAECWWWSPCCLLSFWGFSSYFLTTDVFKQINQTNWGCTRTSADQEVFWFVLLLLSLLNKRLANKFKALPPPSDWSVEQTSITVKIYIV